MEEQQPAASSAPERAPEPAQSFDSQEPAGSPAPERAYSNEPGAVSPESPAPGSPDSGPRGYDRGLRDRGRGGRGGRRPLPRRRSGGGYESDRPRGDADPAVPRADDSREDRPADFDRSTADDEHETPARASYDDEAPRDRDDEFAERDEPRRLDDDREDYPAAEGEGAPDEEPPIRSESGEGYERPRPLPARPPERRDRERPPRGGGRFDRRDRGGDRGPDRGRFADRDRDRDRGGDRDRDRDRDRGRGGDRGRERSIYMELRSQVDRIRHTLETVQRDLERVLQTIAQAEQEQRLSEEELETLKQQLAGITRGGGGGGGFRERERGGDRPREGGAYTRPPEDHHD